MFICYLNSDDSYICYSHHEIKSAYCNKCGTGVEAPLRKEHLLDESYAQFGLSTGRNRL
jgi:hypothetical protein